MLHDFGTVIGVPGKRLTHDFVIKNHKAETLEITDVVNAKTCCGDVEWIGPRSLAKGDAATLRVTLRVGTTVGPLQHRAIIRTRGDPGTDVEFDTIATVVPKLVIREAVEDLKPLTSGEASWRGFVLTAYGTAQEPPVALADSEVRCEQELRWDGPATERHSDGGVVERSRPFRLLLSADGLPGQRQASLEVYHGGESIFSHPVSWEIAPSLKAVPSAVIFDWAGKPIEKQVLIQSMDGQDFDIVGVESDHESVHCEARPTKSHSRARLLKLVLNGASDQPSQISEVRVW
jgi:hypothetical protein